MKLTTHPNIAWIETEGRVDALLPGAGAAVSGNPSLRAICELFADGLDTTAAAVEHIESEVVDRLYRGFLLLADAELPLANRPMAVSAAHPVGRRIEPFHLMTIAADEIVLLHAPIETTRGQHASVVHGGRRVREHLGTFVDSGRRSLRPDDIVIDFDLGCQIEASALRIADLGDVEFSPESDPPASVGERTTAIVRRLANAAARPIILGGDHATTYHVVKGLCERHTRFGVIHFDAHHDFYTSDLPSTDNPPLNHANVMGWVRGIKEVEHIVQIGLRDIYRMPVHARPLGDGKRVDFVSARQAERNAAAQILGQLDPTLPYYVSFDVDVLGFAGPTTTATPVGGGLSYWAAFDILAEIFSSVSVIGLDVVEVADAKLADHAIAEFAARMILLFAMSIRQTDAINDYAGR